jgi:hypothetical protein
MDAGEPKLEGFGACDGFGKTDSFGAGQQFLEELRLLRSAIGTPL